MLPNKFNPLLLSTVQYRAYLGCDNLHSRFRWENSAGVAVHYLGIDRDAQLLAAAEQRLKEAHLLAAKRGQRLEAQIFEADEMEVILWFRIWYIYIRDIGETYGN